MTSSEIKVKTINSNYSIIIGNRVLNLLPKKLKSVCPQANKIGVILDKRVPKKYKIKIKKLLKKYKVFFFEYTANEKLKSLSKVESLVEKCLLHKFNRSDCIISVGGGVIGDFTGFVASIIKRGINFVNIPTTLLAQVDSSIGGKTGVNSKNGKNLIGSFYQPKLVISDISFLKSLPRREIVCGYAEILKHSIILDKPFFNWLKLNSLKMINARDEKLLNKAIVKSCRIKLFFVKKDENEKNARMTLNFGHTFAHAIEAKNNFSDKINHGEAVLMGMLMAAKLSYKKKICTLSTLNEMIEIYEKNKFNFKLENYFQKKEYKKILDFMVNDKKNNDEKINFILLKNIGKTSLPGKHKLNIKELKKIFNQIT